MRVEKKLSYKVPYCKVTPRYSIFEFVKIKSKDTFDADVTFFRATCADTKSQSGQDHLRQRWRYPDHTALRSETGASNLVSK